MFGFLFVCLPPSNLSLVFSFGLFQFFFSGFGWLTFVVLKRKKRDGFGFWGCFGGCGGICLSFLLGSSSLFWFSFEKQCDQTVWVMVMCWVVWTDTKAEEWPEKKKNQNKTTGIVNSLGRGGKKGEKKILVPIVAFHWGQKAWVALLNKAQHFWDVWTRAVWGLFGADFCLLLFFLLWLPLIAYMMMCGSPARVCSVWILFSLCVRMTRGDLWVTSFPSRSPFPARLLWFPSVCFEGQRHRVLCPDFNSSARERCSLHL